MQVIITIEKPMASFDLLGPLMVNVSLLLLHIHLFCLTADNTGAATALWVARERQRLRKKIVREEQSNEF